MASVVEVVLVDVELVVVAVDALVEIRAIM